MEMWGIGILGTMVVGLVAAWGVNTTQRLGQLEKLYADFAITKQRVESIQHTLGKIADKLNVIDE
jgi:hypothetical protein